MTYNQDCKQDAGKLRLDLIPPSLIEAVGSILTYGAEEHGANTWQQVEPERYVAAAMRHWNEYRKDPDSVDDESGLPHLWHCACNICFLIELTGAEKTIVETHYMPGTLPNAPNFEDAVRNLTKFTRAWKRALK